MSATESKPTDRPKAMQSFLREPTVHFFLLAGIIFLIYALIQANTDNVLEISQREIDARVFLQEMTTGEELTEQQRLLVSTIYIEEQILVREALAMNLDNDARIHNMLAQKMRHVLSGNVIQPSESELTRYYQINSQRYQTLATVSVDELVFDDVGQLPAAVIAGLAEGIDASSLLDQQAGNSSPLPNVNRIDLANIFEPEFADDVFEADLSRWVGPFISNRGQHWLRVTQQTEARLPPLPEIADRVRLDWISEEEESRLQAEIDKLWDRYTIVISND